MKACTDKRCPFPGYRLTPKNGRTYEVNGVHLFTTGHQEKDVWYISFFEVGHEDAVHYVVTLDEFDLINSYHLNRISAVHPNAPMVGKYRHFKGNLYCVKNALFSPAERRWFVSYKALYDEALASSFIRTLEDFNKDVGDREITPRFVLEAA